MVVQDLNVRLNVLREIMLRAMGGEAPCDGCPPAGGVGSRTF
jgi:hypothetical protein